MRIVHLITRLDRGGSAVNTLLSAIHQAKSGHRVWLVHGAIAWQAMPAKEREALKADLARFAAAGGHCCELASLRRAPGGHDLVALLQIRRLLREIRPAIVHTHTSKAGALGRLAARAIGARIVHTPHGHIFGGYFPRWQERIYLQIERALAPFADRLVALTETEMREQLNFGIGKKEQWVVIPSGVDVADFRHRVQRWRAALKKEAFWAVSVARLEPVKGIDRLLRVWQAVVREEPQARLAIVGDGSERARLQKLAQELGIAKHVHFAGFDDPAFWLAKTRRFVLFSRNEGMGRAVVEAMAAGCVPIVSPNGALAEVVGSAGRIVVPERTEEAARAILAPVDEEAIARATTEAERWSLEVMLAKLDALYRDLGASR